MIVVGAGLAGLTAAQRLGRHGLRVTVLEARSRVGGRTWSVPFGEVVFDYGGQWIGPSQRRMHALVHAMGLKTAPTYDQGKKILELQGRLSRYGGTIPRLAPWKLIRLQLTINRIERMRKQVPRDQPWCAPHAARWDAMTLQSFLEKSARSADVIALINAAVRVIFGADAGELSLLHFLAYVSSSGGLMTLIETRGGHQESRIVGGAQQIASKLAEACADLHLDRPVEAILQDDQGVQVHTPQSAHRADRVIVAIPPPLAGRIDYGPSLTTLRSQLFQRVSMGQTIKCLAYYDKPFWRDQGLSGESVCTRGPVSVVYDNTSTCGQACLLAFVVAAPARGWAERPETARKQLVLETFARYFGEAAFAPTAYHEVDWATERWTGAAPIANFPPETLSVFGPCRRQG